MVENSTVRVQCEQHKEEAGMIGYFVKEKRLACPKCIKKVPEGAPIIDVNDVMIRQTCSKLVT